MPLSSERDPFNIPIPVREMAVFRGISGEALFSIAAGMRERVFGPGETIVFEGSVGDHIYVIGTGSAEVVKGAGTNAETVLAHLGPGAFFGEMGLIEDDRRSATVRACEDETTIFSLGREHVMRMATEHPRQYHTIMCNIALELSRRLRALDAAYAALRRERPSITAPAPGVGWQGVFIFEGLAPDAVRALAMATTEVKLRPGQFAFEEGAPGDSVWLVGEGSVEVVKSVGQPGETVLAVLGHGSVFGEMCLVEGGPRSAAIRARESSIVHCLALPVFQKFAAYWPADHARIIFNIARELSRRLRSLDTSAFTALSGMGQ
ncbi:MAG TPA: cyclic nucleotide-binding domain-containing protein [Verrucomicrobiae bacterium]|nr:cyclic nucleotide-binding domain-containing protein [Verrucomicrobiae bacterium]